MFYKTKYLAINHVFVLVSDGTSLVGLFIEGQRYFMNGFEEAIEDDSLEIFIKTKRMLDKYFKGEVVDFKNIPLKFYSTDFRKLVWSILLDIGYGVTVSYKDIGDAIKKKTSKNVSLQAVGSAIGHNPISIIVPCHRVINSNGNIGGYASSIDIKKRLLELENKNKI